MNRTTLVQRARAYHTLGLDDKALGLYDQLIKADPNDWLAWAGKSYVLCRSDDRQEEALQCAAMHCKLRSEDAEAWINLGILYMQTARTDEALGAYDEAIRCDPNNEGAHWNRSHALLMNGSYSEGWAEYEWGNKSIRGLRRHQNILAWEGQYLRGKTVLVWSEQGFGDVIQFSRYLKYLKYMGAQIIFEVPRELLRLFDTGTHKLLERGKTCEEKPDYQCSLLSLPYLLGTHIERHYFNPQSAHERDILPQRKLAGHPFNRTGIVWQGRVGHQDNELRSIRLEQFLEVLDSRTKHVCLQKEVSKADESLMLQWGVADLRDSMEDFVDTANLIGVCDRIITIDTAVAHLAGTMGVETWLLLPFEPDWRWKLKGSTTPWYQSMRLFRQPKRGDWDSVLEQVRHQLGCDDEV